MAEQDIWINDYRQKQLELQNADSFKGNNFAIRIPKLPSLVFMANGVTIPTISLGNTLQANLFPDIKHPGEKLTYGQLSVSFALDEKLHAFREIFDWMKELAPTNDLTTYKSLPSLSSSSIMTDMQVFLLSNMQNPSLIFNFKGTFPSSIDGISLTTTESDTTLVVSVTFDFSEFDVITI